MELKFDKDYLEKLARLETPDRITLQDYQACYDYCQLRNSAKDLLRNPKNRRQEKRLSGLILKLRLGIIN